jgi:hypothetical protein
MFSMPLLVFALAQAHSTGLPAPNQMPTDAQKCANWPGACPNSDPSAPFLRLPKVEALAPCQGRLSGSECDKNSWSHVFVSAAHFPIPRFTASGEPVSADGLVIYEGMKLTVYPDSGYYDLSFTATSPNIPVTLRLQLELSHPQQEGFRLTLPPIIIEPTGDSRYGDTKGLTVAVNHRGHSELFKKTVNLDTKLIFPQSTPPLRAPGTAYADKEWQVRRLGVARFGLSTPTSDDFAR